MEAQTGEGSDPSKVNHDQILQGQDSPLRTSRLLSIGLRLLRGS